MSQPGIWEGKMGHREGDVLVVWKEGTSSTGEGGGGFEYWLE